MIENNTIYQPQNCTTPGFVNVSSIKTWQQMAPSYRSQCPEEIFLCPNVQNLDSRNNLKFAFKRRVAGVNTPQRCILPYTDTQRIPFGLASDLLEFT